MRLHRGPLQILITEIVSGQHSAGDALPREADLATRFDVSRGIAREVIRALEERGLISVKHGRGATVRPPEAWDTTDPEVLAAVLAGPSGADALAGLLEARKLLEIGAAGLAAQRADAASVAQLSRAYDQMVATADRARDPAHEGAFHHADVTFHRLLVAASKNQTLIAVVGKIHEAMVEARFPLARPQLRNSRTLPEHRRILDAIASGNRASAEAAMERHLDSVGEFLAEYKAARDSPMARAQFPAAPGARETRPAVPPFTARSSHRRP